MRITEQLIKLREYAKQLIEKATTNDDEMKFSESYEKLGWTIFTTIRKSTARYRLGKKYLIITPLGSFNAKVIGLFSIKKRDITDDLAKVDAETTAKGLIQMLESWYGEDFDDFVLITLWRI